MKNTITKYLILAGILLISIKGIAQQDPVFTQYMYNMSVVNPAYATDDPGMLRLGGIYRSQWAGVEGAPNTVNFFAHTPISERIEVGLTVVHDEIGDGWQKENNITADFAYIIPVGPSSKLSFGVKAGVTTFDQNTKNIDQSDFAFENISDSYPAFGAGVYWFGENYYLGLSTPNFFTAKHIDRDDIEGFGKEQIHGYLTGGYVFDLSSDVKLKPAFMARAVENSPVSVDVTANVLLYDRLEAGLGYRFDESVTGMVNFKITPQLRVGYAYDYTTTDFRNYNDGSHEIMVLFDLDLFGLKKGYDKSPRFF
ncbi:type IX secretion system membrane protein PorP/SprF [Zunongwangia sp.]|uniref:PorP/SprF family type IX secretion system membrane protein n=1 Tax=Zunongwangia sp. TaxID=1965325 RepID=UPI003AA95F54